MPSDVALDDDSDNDDDEDVGEVKVIGVSGACDDASSSRSC